MLDRISPLAFLTNALSTGKLTPSDVASKTIQTANSNASRNTYLYFNPDSLRLQAEALTRSRPVASTSKSLFGIPISLKDCFDFRETPTTCGSQYYAHHHAVAIADSSIARNLKRSGALITGKTHLHPLAYGITGQNPDYRDCLQPRDPSLLTGGSSSGAAASVQENSALAAIGTDTGGSIRVPAALCGLVGYRASHNLTSSSGCFPDGWNGGAHLAPSFDTLGFLLRDPRDAAPIAESIFNIPHGSAKANPAIGFISEAFLFDCEPEVLSAFEHWKDYLAGLGGRLALFHPDFWKDSMEIFAPIQAHEASILHRGTYDHFEASIRDRLIWGASLTEHILEPLRSRWQQFIASMDALFSRFDFLVLPAAPVSRLSASADLSNARSIILRYTTPFSLARVPALSLPGELIGAPLGTGIQIAAAPAADPSLLAFASMIGNSLADVPSLD